MIDSAIWVPAFAGTTWLKYFAPSATAYFVIASVVRAAGASWFETRGIAALLTMRV
jgi:hypothetical protein